MRYQNVPMEDGRYIAVSTNHNENIGIVLTERETTEIDQTTYSDAAGNITYENAAWHVRVKNGKCRKI